MNFLYSLPLTVPPGPEDGELKTGLSIADVTPGLLGFLATLFLALAVVFLIRDMVKRIRRVRYREQALTGVGTDVFIPSTEDVKAAEAGRAGATDGTAASTTPVDGSGTTPGYHKRG
ncbi:hypothetical protein QMA10_02440 [Arthrobacter sp. APC 3897]|uniref:hypothetical protein n=1 Tax=Arthrobacter sp. APC 3897 TaxID=3035204 RepID=UPI0025B41338|nr:hypothetical protein [Arthrobacter sp. APC 3897]MDN3480786.1 hypothetical protein [Arthrobacter sp. APC 3897]